MPLAGDRNFGLRIQASIARNPETDKLEIQLFLQQNSGGMSTTLQEGTFRMGEDMLFDRLQEHTNNYLRQMVNRWAQYEKQNPRR